MFKEHNDASCIPFEAIGDTFLTRRPFKVLALKCRIRSSFRSSLLRTASRHSMDVIFLKSFTASHSPCLNPPIVLAQLKESSLHWETLSMSLNVKGFGRKSSTDMPSHTVEGYCSPNVVQNFSLISLNFHPWSSTRWRTTICLSHQPQRGPIGSRSNRRRDSVTRY
jgi:hypothetical protein